MSSRAAWTATGKSHLKTKLKPNKQKENEWSMGIPSVQERGPKFKSPGADIKIQAQQRAPATSVVEMRGGGAVEPEVSLQHVGLLT